MAHLLPVFHEDVDKVADDEGLHQKGSSKNVADVFYASAAGHEGTNYEKGHADRNGGAHSHAKPNYHGDHQKYYFL